MLAGRAWPRLAAVLGSVFVLYFLWTNSHSRQQSAIGFVPSSFDWSTLPNHYQQRLSAQAVQGEIRQLPRVQHDFAGLSADFQSIQEQRRQIILNKFKQCWRSYREHAWMKDELMPITANGKDRFGGWAATLIDSLDTLWIMDLKPEFYEAVQAVASIDWNSTPDRACNVFETTIRHLGGLLSAYDLSGHQVLLQKAIELGDMLLVAFDTPSGLPAEWLDFEKARGGLLEAPVHAASTSAASLAMEFTRLSQVADNSRYYEAVTRVALLMEKAQNHTIIPGMWPAFWDFVNLDFKTNNYFTIGALADSSYEYLAKMHALTGGADLMYDTMYRITAEAIKNNLMFRPMTPDEDDILFTGTVNARLGGINPLYADSEHLACFIGGMFGLGGKLSNSPEHVELGMKLAKGCVWAYNSFPAGIMPESFNLIPCPDMGKPCPWNEERWQQEVLAQPYKTSGVPRGFAAVRSAKYQLRPEAIESVFVLYRITGREDLLEDAWKMFEAIEKATATPYCNAALSDVMADPPLQVDSMESFWLAETLKYFYLIFSPPDVISLDEWVLNTEAHPFKRPT